MVATIWYWKAAPTLPLAVNSLTMRRFRMNRREIQVVDPTGVGAGVDGAVFGILPAQGARAGRDRVDNLVPVDVSADLGNDRSVVVESRRKSQLVSESTFQKNRILSGPVTANSMALFWLWVIEPAWAASTPSSVTVFWVNHPGLDVVKGQARFVDRLTEVVDRQFHLADDRRPGGRC